jgi:TPR repeat protein
MTLRRSFCLSLLGALSLAFCLLSCVGNHKQQAQEPIDKELLSQAQEGDVEAQMQVALAYDELENYAEAASWYRKAAEQGLSQAQNNLGVMLKDGQGVTQDYVEAAQWFKCAAQQGNTLAEMNLGWCYHAGKGVSLNADSAQYWYSLAANKGLPTAQLNLGILYLQNADTTTALLWLQKAEQQGNEGAAKILKAMSTL